MSPAELINFGMEPVTPSIIMVAGVGGGGSNAVNHMYELGISQVTFMICNTDKQALRRSSIPNKVELGKTLTDGLGSGNIPERGRAAAIESLDEVVAAFKREGTRMVFITAGMGGGTGTGAAPVIAKAARELGILTVGIVTLPFRVEGRVRSHNAIEGVELLRKEVDALLVINNENIQEIYGKLPLTEAFGKADDILASAAKGIAEIITRTGVVNVDFADVNTVMRNSGIALMGSGRASGENRARAVADMSLSSPLLNHNSIRGAKNILLNITSGEKEITMDELQSIAGYIHECAGDEPTIIWGAGSDPALGDHIEVTIIATGFNVDESSLWNPGQLDGGRSVAPILPPETEPRIQPGQEAAPQSGGTLPREDSQPDQQRRPRWQPPTASTHPLWPVESKPPVPVRADSAADQNPLASKPSSGIQSPSHVIEVKPHDIYKNLKQVEETPSYVRRKAKLVVDTGAKTTRSVIKGDTTSEPQPSQEGSLFD